MRSNTTQTGCASASVDHSDQGLPQDLPLRVAELERQNSELRKELSIIAMIFESQEGMLITGPDSVILRANQAYVNLTGYCMEEIVGKQPSVFHTGLYDESFYQKIRDTLKENGFWQGNIQDRRKNGTIYVQRLNISVIKSVDGTVSHYVASFADNTHEKELSDKVHQLAYYDSLTNLPNRRLFQNRLEKALLFSERHNKCGALLFIDLDNFKTLNDTLGHDVGDLLLTQVAKRLSGCMRKSDTVARFGGDEFVVILEQLCCDVYETAIQAKEIGEKIIKALNKTYQLRNYEYNSTPSIGITLFNAHNNSMENLLKQADIAMYAAKAAGRNNVHFYSSEMQAAIVDDSNRKMELTRAVKEHQFKLHFQLQVTHDYQASGAEAFLRWQHPERGLVSAREFISLAEKNGLIVPIGYWVLETVCAQLKQWEANLDTRNFQLAVNISALQFFDDCFIEKLCSLMDTYAIKPGRLKLELTECLLLNKIDETILKMNEVKKYGVSFSMDDFGTGFSSLSYLTQLPFDQIKIDRSFVRNIGVKSADTVIVQTIIGMANNLGLDVIAEGVETEEQRAFLQFHGCPAFQGYLLGKPVPIEQFELLLTQNWIPPVQ